MQAELIGYADKFSVTPGETIRFMVSTDQSEYEAVMVRLIHADENPAGPGFKEEVIASHGQFSGRKQTAYPGSCMIVEDNVVLRQVTSLTLQAWIYPTTSLKGVPQGIITKWSKADESGYGLYIGEKGDVGLWLGEGHGRVERLYTG